LKGIFLMKVFIDGQSGTTGLKIFSRLNKMADIDLLTLTQAQRRDAKSRREALNSCDVAFLCLPDEAARQAAAMVENEHVVVIDASTAHRTCEGWTYGFPELSDAARAAIRKSRRIAVPGCHASGFIALIRPLTDAGILDPAEPLTCFSVTGYSGGGKNMIAEYESEDRGVALEAPRQYALAQMHKHLPEMLKMAGLSLSPVFCPVVADFYSGMTVTVTLHLSRLKGADAAAVKKVYAQKYAGKVVAYKDADDTEGFIAANALSCKDSMHICVAGNAERLLLIAGYDNLGKGASGAAIQCMNIATGREETAGLEL
jgi:N-acetyl-gamma-glutamyl-phosphate reductase